MVILQGNVEDLFSDTKEKVDPGMTTTDSVLQLIGLVLLLLFILLAAYYTSKFVGGIKLGQIKNSNFKVIDTLRLGPNKAIHIVKTGNKYIVVAIGKDTINYITELDETDILMKDNNTSEKQNFKQILDKLRNKNE